LGGPAVALEAWRAGRTPPAAAHARFAHPSARIREGQWLAAHGASAAIDVSDGLVADARHMAAASGKSLVIALDKVPCVDGCSATTAAASGEEYELLVAAPASLDSAAFARQFGVALTMVGAVQAADGPRGVSVTRAGARVEFTGGYDHFSA
jgi:thiamine-monophosphate kinase